MRLATGWTEDNLASNVHRGETMDGSSSTTPWLAPSTRVWTKTTSVSVAREWKPENLKVIGFLQEQQDWRIIGAGWSEVEGPTVK
jgi:hypothetical protein